MVDMTTGLGASQSDLADAINRKYVGYSQRQRNEAMRSADGMASNQFADVYQPQLQEATQPTELLTAGRTSDIPIVYKDNSLYSNDNTLNSLFTELNKAGYSNADSYRPQADYIAKNGMNYYNPDSIRKSLQAILPNTTYNSLQSKYSTAMSGALTAYNEDQSTGDMSGMTSQGYSGPNNTAQTIGQGLGLAGNLSGNYGLSAMGGMMSAANSPNPNSSLAGWGTGTIAGLAGKGQYAGPLGMLASSLVSGQLPSTRSALVGLMSIFAPQYALPLNVLNTLYSMFSSSNNPSLGEMGMGLNGAYGFGSGEGVAGIGGGTPAGFDAGDLGFGIGGPSGFGFGGTDTAPGFSAGDLGNGISGGFGFGGDSSSSGSSAADGGADGGAAGGAAGAAGGDGGDGGGDGGW